VRPRSGSALKRAVPAPFPSTILAVALLIAWSSDARAGAWARDRGEAYAKSSVSYLRAEEMFDDSGEIQPLFDPALYEHTRYSERAADLYVDYGLFRALTLGASR
jgi:hypothetical protein